MFAWAVKRELVSVNPFHNLPISSATTERDRALNDEELVEIYAAAQKLPYPFGPFYLLALFTLQRREEVAGMRWSELSRDLSLWTIPAERMKNHKPHDVHLSEPARSVLRSIPRAENQDYVFTTTGKTAISGFSRARRALDAEIARARDGAPLAPWRLHDFRRTGVTRLAAMGFDSIVADKLLAHKPARLKGVAAIYQRHEFTDERRRALEAWAAHLTRAEPVNVVAFRSVAQ
jgi:integrase